MNSFQKAAVVFVVSTLYLVCLAWAALSNHSIPDGDFAADMLLTNRIWDEGYLLVGHYSRWQFNHPGPFWFYYNAIVEFVFGWFFSSRLQAWQLGSILLNSTFITFSAVSLSKLLLNKVCIKYSLLVSLLSIGFFGGDVSSLWMPHRFIAPYAAFLVCVLGVLLGNQRYILPATFVAGVLVHGYATMPFLTLPLLVGGALIGYRQKKRLHLSGGYKDIILFSCAIALVFALPIAVDCFVSKTPNLLKLISASDSFKDMPKPSWHEMFVFISELLFEEKPAGLLLAALALLPILITAKSWSEALRSKVIFSFGLFVFVLVLTIVYYKNSPAPIYPFVAKYIVGIPPLLFAVAIAPAFLLWKNEGWYGGSLASTKKTVIFGLIVFVVFALSFPLTFSGKPGPGVAIVAFADKIQKISPDKRVAIDYADHAQWPFIAGLLLELNERGIDACVALSHLEYLYTSKHTCSLNTFPDVRIVQADACDDTCLLNAGDFGLKIFSPKRFESGETINFNQDGVGFLSWSTPEQTFRWSSGDKSKILFLLDRSKDGFKGTMILDFGTYGKQRIAILLNGTTIYSTEANSLNESLWVDFSPEILKDGENMVEFVLPDARKPNNGDQRLLALAFKSFQIR